MEEKALNEKEAKAKRKAYQKARAKAVRSWKGLTWFSLPFAILFTAAAVFTSIFDNSLSIFVGGTFNHFEKDSDAVYYALDFDSEEQMTAYGLELCERVEAEGAALLLNENNALPLGEGARVSCFSNSSGNLVYGGTGSGNIDASTANTLKSALEASGMVVNPTLWDFYLNEENAPWLRKVGSMVSTEAAEVSELPWARYTNAVKASVADYGDAAIVTISRVGGEGADLTFLGSNYLALDADEREMMENIAEMKRAGTVDRIIVLINSANALQVDFLKENEYGVDACLWIGDVGISGIDAVADILAGRVNPSGSLADTYCYDNYSSPAMANFVPTAYAGYEKGAIPDNASTYMIYQEGIYVGYKYYETRYEDYVTGAGNAGDYAYHEAVAFPFGYGLSYTDFSYSGMQTEYDAAADGFRIRLTVTNTGNMAGKRTVQVYASSPYTQYDRENGVEKAAVALVGFAKTEVLEPAESETVEILVDRRDLASFDAYGAGTYILEDGDYWLTCASDAHQAANNVLAAKGYTPANTQNRMDAAGDSTLVYCWNNPSFDAQTYAVSQNGTAITSRLSASDINRTEAVSERISYLSRSDWTGTFPTEILQLTLTDALTAKLQNVQYRPEDYETAKMPTMGAKNGLRLVELMGAPYDDSRWETLLDQMTFREMVSLIGDSFHWTMPIESIQAPGTRDENGPQGLTASLFTTGVSDGKTAIKATAFTSEDVMAATFNTDLLYAVGRVIGNNCIAADIACLYGPGANTHRTPYGGRNFEYYSEDAFLAGEMGKHEVQGLADKGIFVVLKHFALNDCEQDRIGLGVWLSEQAAREIYLKAFQAPIEEADAGVMVAYTRWGAVWSGANEELMSGILRGEWGKIGLNITDNVLTAYVNGVDGLMAGGVSTFDAMLPLVTNQLPKYKKDAVVVTAMREACHQNLYSIVNSAGMNGVSERTRIKKTDLRLVKICKGAAAAFCLLFAVSLAVWLVKRRRFGKGGAYGA
ncbi:MAG: glycoside hydrolase family 3 C-terminal domain-containing protein [Roseburia sp.]|nr:glycoside hydrolase family 3 C-terminal domain-containing protein [Roseburia sp.]